MKTPPGSQIPSKPGGDVDPIAKNVVALDQHVAEVDVDAIEDALRLRGPDVAFGHQFLDCDRALDRGDDGGKFHEEAVARRLDDASAVAGGDWPRRLAMLAHGTRRPRLVLAHEARVADHVGGEDRGGRIVKTTGDGLLMEFPSVVVAVECAIAIQRLMGSHRGVSSKVGRPERSYFEGLRTLHLSRLSLLR
ncbi:MAG TPA: hypothetical protein VKA12_06720 [Roseiarcus sp.]|nr:hypothetical protein [Roseiarcus sp.]